jgi:maleate isomerase
MLPPGVSLHVTRLRMRGGEAALSMLEELEDAALLLADAGVDRIIFHCTSVSMWSSEIALFIERRIRAVTNIPLTQTSGAVLQALHSVASATRIVLVSPYLADTHLRECRFLETNGIAILRDRGLGLAPQQMSAVEPGRWEQEVVALQDPLAEAYFLSCTAIRSAEIIESLERTLERPVLTGNSVAMWGALRASGIPDAVPGFGRLLRT